MKPKPKKQRAKAQSAQAAEKVAAAKNPPKNRSGIAPEEWTKQENAPKAAAALKAPKTDHDRLAEMEDTYAKIAKAEKEIEDLRWTVKARRERLSTLNRELRSLLAGQLALAFGQPANKVGKPEKLDTTSDWFEVRDVGSNRYVTTLKIGDPHLGDYKKQPRDYVVRPLPADAAKVHEANAAASGLARKLGSVPVNGAGGRTVSTVLAEAADASKTPAIDQKTASAGG
jgi:hypothetical protein